MSNAFINDFAEKLIANGIADEDAPFIGCSEEDIAEIERKLTIKLPAIYRAFLLKMGRNPGDFLRGEECCYPDLLTMVNDAQETLKESNTVVQLPPTTLVIWMSQGTQFSYFDTADGEDPPVFHYREYDPAPVKRYDHYSQWLDHMLSDQIMVRESIRKRREENP